MGCLGLGVGGNDEPLDQWAVTYTVTLPYLGTLLTFHTCPLAQVKVMVKVKVRGERCKVR